jgi:hypothetical protein
MDKALAQTVRCYSPADLLLLLEGTGRALKRIEVDGHDVDFSTHWIALSQPDLEAWGLPGTTGPRRSLGSVWQSPIPGGRVTRSDLG